MDLIILNDGRGGGRGGARAGDGRDGNRVGLPRAAKRLPCSVVDGDRRRRETTRAAVTERRQVCRNMAQPHFS